MRMPAAIWAARGCCATTRHARHAGAYQVYVAVLRAPPPFTVDDTRTGRILNRCERHRQGRKKILSLSPTHSWFLSSPVQRCDRLRSLTCVVRWRILSPVPCVLFLVSVSVDAWRRHSKFYTVSTSNFREFLKRTLICLVAAY